MPVLHSKNYTQESVRLAKPLKPLGYRWQPSCTLLCQVCASQHNVMNRFCYRIPHFLVWLAASLWLLTGCNGVNAHPPAGMAGDSDRPLPFAREAAPLVVHENTMIYVRLQQSLSSATAQTGQKFSAVLDAPLLAGDQTVAPGGSPVTGSVVAVRQSGHLHNAGYLRITLTSIQVNGQEMPLATSSVFAGGGSYKKRNFAFIGGGAGGGALIGALAGGGKGAAIGSLVGAGAGTAGAYATGKKEAGFTVERRLGFRLTEPLTVSAGHTQVSAARTP